MSDLFLKNNNIINNNMSESSINLTEILGMSKNNNKFINSATSSDNINNFKNIVSATSNNMMRSSNTNTFNASSNMLGGTKKKSFNTKLSNTFSATSANTNTFSATSANMTGGANNFSATSANMTGGANNFSATSSNIVDNNTIFSKINKTDINNLLSMLTSESNDTTTSRLEDNLRNMLTQNGGNNKCNENTNMLEKKKNKLLKQLGGNINNNASAIITLAGLGAAGAIINNYVPNDTESEINYSKIIDNSTSPQTTSTVQLSKLTQLTPIIQTIQPNPIQSTQLIPVPQMKKDTIKINMEVPSNSYSPTTSSEMPQDNFSVTSSEQPFLKSKPNNASNNASNNSSNPFLNTTTTINNTNDMNNINDNRLAQLVGGENLGMVKFREICVLVSKKLNIPNGAKTKKIAGQLQRDVKEKNKNISYNELVNAAKIHLEKNLNTYKKMI